MATVGKNENRSSTTELLPEVPKAVVQPDFTLNHYEFDHVHSNFDMNGLSATGKAIGGFVISGNPGNNEELLIIDALGTTVCFIVRTASNDVSGAVTVVSGENRVMVGVQSVLGNNAGIAGRFKAAINATQINFWVGASQSSNRINLRQQIAGPHGNTEMDEDVTGLLIDHDNLFVRGANYTQPPFSKRFAPIRALTPGAGRITEG